MKYMFFPMILCAMIACNNAEEVTSKKQEVSTSISVSDSVLRFQVSFISVGSGIDHAAKQQLSDLITNFNTTNQATIVPEIIQWGREGERDFRFKMDGIDLGIQKKFIAESTALLTKNPLVKIYENMPPKHKGKG